jgi:hypothetical protein
MVEGAGGWAGEARGTTAGPTSALTTGTESARGADYQNLQGAGAARKAAERRRGRGEFGGA